MLIHFLSFFALIIILLIFLKVDYAAILLLLYINLVPLVSTPILGFPLVKNYLFMLITIAVLMKGCFGASLKSDKAFVIRYVLYFYLFCAVASLFAWNTSLCLSYIRSDLFSFLLFPLALIGIADRHQCFQTNAKIAFLISICIICGYALLLAPLHGLNPYIDYLRLTMGADSLNEDWAAAEDRLFGRISSTFFHPMIFGNFLVCSFVYSGFVLIKEQKKILWIPLIMVAAASVICGVRSVLIAEFVASLVYLFYNGMTIKKLSSIAIIGSIVFYLFSLYLPDLFGYLQSPFVEDSSVQGSSVEMRLRQFSAIFEEISDCFLFGHGNGWTVYFMSINGNHPIMLAFESLVLKVGCEYGLLGSAFYIFVFYKIFTLEYADYYKNIFSKCITAGYLGYSFVTGDYGYMMNYILVYTLIMIYDDIQTNNKIIVP